MESDNPMHGDTLKIIREPDNIVQRGTLILTRTPWLKRQFRQTMSHINEDFPDASPWLINKVQKWKKVSVHRLHKAIKNTGDFRHQVHVIKNDLGDGENPNLCHDFNDVIKQCQTEKALLNLLISYYSDRIHLTKPWTETYEEYNAQRRNNPNRGHDWTYYGDEESHSDMEETESQSS